MKNTKPDYVPAPEHAMAKLEKFKRWQESIAGMSPRVTPVGPIAPRPNNDKRDFVPAEPIPGDRYPEQRGSLRDQAAKLEAQKQTILSTPTDRRRRWDEAKARAVEMLKDKELLGSLKPDQIGAIKTVAEAVYSPELVAKDEADKKFRIARLTQAVG